MSISLSKSYLILLFYIAPFVDAISGYLILSGIIPEGGVGSPSQVFRLLLLLLMTIISMREKQFFRIIVFLIAYLVLIEFSFFMFHLSIYGYIIGLIYGNKLVYLTLVFISLSILLKHNQITYISLIMYIRNYIALTAIILLLSFMLGLGFHTYGEGTFGFKGFFAAGNGLGIFLGIGLLISVYYWKLTKDKYSLLLSLLIIFATIIIGSKTALVLSMISLIMIVFSFQNYFLKFLIFTMLFLGVSINITEILSIFQTVFDVITFRFSNSDSVLSWIFSNRDNYFIHAINSVSFDNFLILRLFIGFGPYISFREPFGTYSSIDILESDFTDIFFMYGLIFTSIYIIFILFNIYKGLTSKKFFLSLIFLLLMGHSFLAGHVLFNGMSGVLVPLLSLLILHIKQGIK